MKIAVTAWEDRISPVFDSARRLLIADVENEQIVAKQYESFNPQPFSRIGTFLKTLQVDVLICGAISQTPSNIIEASGVRLISFVGGKIDDIIESYAKGSRIVPEFSMPGCGRQHRRKRRQRNGIFQENMEVVIMPRGDGTGPGGKGKAGRKGKDGCQDGGSGQGRRQGTGKGGRGGRGSGQGCGRGKGRGQGQNNQQD